MKRSLQVLGAVLVGWGMLAGSSWAAGPVATQLAVPTAAAKQVLIDTGAPGGWFGYWGFDIYTEQTVGARFTVPVDSDFKLSRIGIWLMNNSDVDQAKIKLTLQTDALDEGGGESLPSGHKLEHWTAPVATFGWTPVQQFFSSEKTPRLKAGHSYWVVAESKAKALKNAVWVTAAEGLLFTSTTYQGAWQTGGEGAALTLSVDAKPVAPK
ncbi:hypothetical protein LRH25_18550 [Ideonella azotifigens]|uniref:Uncharacterized protein n=1 Tax=Ideonella azotifigens TaxID=513160 RepID=A0ABP3VHG1_9BURK|nr:hypothetical protein [Ideonella azotifigens]MCD2342333.1 hypothetical protein [Ideonella azotifigens]